MRLVICAFTLFGCYGSNKYKRYLMLNTHDYTLHLYSHDELLNNKFKIYNVEKDRDNNKINITSKVKHYDISNYTEALNYRYETQDIYGNKHVRIIMHGIEFNNVNRHNIITIPTEKSKIYNKEIGAMYNGYRVEYKQESEGVLLINVYSVQGFSLKSFKNSDFNLGVKYKSLENVGIYPRYMKIIDHENCDKLKQLRDKIILVKGSSDYKIACNNQDGNDTLIYESNFVMYEKFKSFGYDYSIGLIKQLINFEIEKIKLSKEALQSIEYNLKLEDIDSMYTNRTIKYLRLLLKAGRIQVID